MVESIDDVPAETRAAIVATPTPDHHGTVLACFAKGWGVLVEKPSTDTLMHSRDLLNTASQADLPFYTGHHRRMHPFSIAARETIGCIGAPVGLQGMWALRKHDSYYDVEWRRLPGAGPLLTNLSHELDLLRFLVGEMTEVSALVSSAQRGFQIEDTAALSFRFANGALGSFLISDAAASPWSFESGSFENPAIAGSGQDYIRIAGTKGALQFPSLTRWSRDDGSEVEWSKPLMRTDAPTFERIDPLLAQIERFAAVMAGGEDDILCTGADGHAALALTLAVALSGKTGAPVRPDEVPEDFSGV